MRSTRVVRQAAAVDWARIYNSLNLKRETVAALQAFRKRHDDSSRELRALNSQQTEVDFSNYRNTIKNTAVVDEIEKTVKNFKPASYDVNAQVKNIEAFEAKAVGGPDSTFLPPSTRLTDYLLTD